MLCGCGSTVQSNGTAAETTENKTTTDGAANGKKTVIEYSHINSETVGGKTLDELVADFNASNDHIEVVARYNPEE